MEQSEIFFLISSIGFIILGTLATIFMVALLYALNSFSKILKKLGEDVDSIGDTTKEMFEDIRGSIIFRFLFQKKRKPAAKKAH